MSKRRLLINAIRCRRCGCVLVSQHVHDFCSCSCGTFTDGGREYLRRGFVADGYDELSIWQDADGGYSAAPKDGGR